MPKNFKIEVTDNNHTVAIKSLLIGDFFKLKPDSVIVNQIIGFDYDSQCQKVKARILRYFYNYNGVVDDITTDFVFVDREYAQVYSAKSVDLKVNF